MGKKLIYLIIIGVTVYLNIMYEWPDGVVLLSGEICLLFFCMAGAFYTGRNLNVHMNLEQILIEQREECCVELRLQNRARVPAAVKIVMVYRYISGRKQYRTAARAYVEGRQEKELVCRFVPEHCGKIEIRIKRAACYDFLGIFSWTKRCKEKIFTTVMPKPYPVNLIVSNRTRWFPVDGESYAQDRSGDDSAEIYDVREYQIGDRMQMVHWKLSAREDVLYIKEFSYPLGAAVVLMMEENRQHTGTESGFAEAVISIASALMEAGCPHYAVWKKKEDDRIRRMLIRQEEDLYELILCVLGFEAGCLETDMEECYRYEYKNDTYSTLIRIDTKLMLQINQNEAVSMAENGLERFFCETEMVV